MDTYQATYLPTLVNRVVGGTQRARHKVQRARTSGQAGYGTARQTNSRAGTRDSGHEDGCAGVLMMVPGCVAWWWCAIRGLLIFLVLVLVLVPGRCPMYFWNLVWISSITRSKPSVDDEDSLDHDCLIFRVGISSSALPEPLAEKEGQSLEFFSLDFPDTGEVQAEYGIENEIAGFGSEVGPWRCSLAQNGQRPRAGRGNPTIALCLYHSIQLIGKSGSAAVVGAKKLLVGGREPVALSTYLGKQVVSLV